MPRAHRHFLPGLVWHVTHRCHRRDFLLHFVRDRDRYVRLLYEARRRWGLCVLDYIVTSNHVHLLLKDTGACSIPRSMQFVAGRIAQEYNLRRDRRGAFWEDRYHATAIEDQAHLHRCLAYVDLNMVRAGVVAHPREWPHSGYREIQSPPARRRVVNLAALADACGLRDIEELQRAHREWIDQGLTASPPARQPAWTEALAVGSTSYVNDVKTALGERARHRCVIGDDGLDTLREPMAPYETVSPPHLLPARL